MSRVFARSLQAIEDDRLGPTHAIIGVGLALLVAWVAWFVSAELRVVERSDRMRLETEASARSIQSTVTARLLRSRLTLGAQVRQGDVLIELDAARPSLELDGLRTRRESCRQQLAALQLELELRERTLLGSNELARALALEARARQREAQTRSSFAQSETERIRGLANAGNLPRLALQRAVTEQQTQQLLSDALEHDVTRTQWESRRKALDDQAGLARLRREVAALEGEGASLANAILKQEDALAGYTIRSPVSGRVGEAIGLGAGAIIDAGMRLGAVVPAGDVLAIAEFSAASTVGRVREGQLAQVRLDGFSWTEYGSLRARVKSVGSEAREGRVRVQLLIDPGSNTRIPLQHGLSGAVEVEVERASPARLSLRALGTVWSGTLGNAAAGHEGKP